MANPRESTPNSGEKLQQQINSGAERMQQTASSLGQRAKEAASSMAQSASETASRIGEKAEEATSAAGNRIESLAGTIRENAPREGFLGTASEAVADRLERGGRYLQEEGLRGMGADLLHLVRSNPIPALLLGIGIGYLIARATRR